KCAFNKGSVTFLAPGLLIACTSLLPGSGLIGLVDCYLGMTSFNGTNDIYRKECSSAIVENDHRNFGFTGYKIGLKMLGFAVVTGRYDDDIEVATFQSRGNIL